MKRECLTQAEAAAYVDGALGADEREKAERHLERCAHCRRSVAELKRLVDAHEAEPVRTPGAALDRAAAIVARGVRAGPVLSITAGLRRGVVKILETTGNILPPPRLEPVPVRGTRRADPGPRVAESLSGYLVTVEIGEDEGGLTAEIDIVDEGSSERPDALKAKLRSADATQTRYSRSGKVRFTSLGTGRFEVDLEGIGVIALEIR